MHLYHKVPQEMAGEVLYPLNTLKEIHPEAYEFQVKKYIGREEVMDNQIPSMNCLWNDVLHFSPVHPQLIFDQLKFLGLNNLPPKIEYFEVDSDLFDPENTTIYLFKNKPLFKMREDNFEEYSGENTLKYTNLPDETKEYYKECITNGKPPLAFHKIPHILHKGNLDTKNIQRIIVS